MSDCKYITLIERKGRVAYKTGKKRYHFGRSKHLKAPVLEGESNYYNNSYDCMGSWYGSEEFRKWVKDEAEEWAEELNAEVVYEGERPDVDFGPHCRVPR
jgi:hypothetical protein